MTTPGDVTALWASARVTELLDGRGEIPAYGSAEWNALRADDARRAAAIITAAEAWRRREAEQARLTALFEHDPDAWYRHVVEDADAAAARLGRTLASTPTWEELRRRRQHKPPTPVRASPGWTPVGIPGRPGWWRHLVDGEQVDLPYRDAPGQEPAA